MFEKVLVCLDGSALAEQILPYLLAAKECFRKIVLLKVVDTSTINLPLGVPGQSGIPMRTRAMDERFNKELAEMPGYLEKIAQPLRASGIDVECVVLEGIPTQAIVDYAAENDVSLIAISTHGHSGLRRITMGSTAEYILTHCGLPVLMVTPTK